MIAPSLGLNDVKGSSDEPRFHVSPPASNPLAASLPLSLTTRSGSDNPEISLEWQEDVEAAVPQAAERLLSLVVESCGRDVEKYPQSARAHTNLGVALLNQGNVERASHHFETALSLDPGYYVAGISLAKIRVSQGNLPAAERLYGVLATAHPRDMTVRLGLASIAILQENFSRAEELLRQAITLGEPSSLAKYQLAMVQLRLGRNREAISLLRSSIRSDVRSPALYQGLGVSYFVSGDLHRAEVSFKTALTLAPQMREAIAGLARVLISRKRHDEAIRLLTGYLEHKDDSQARELLSSAYYEIKQYRSARAQLQHVFHSLGESTSPEVSIKKGVLANNIGACLSRERQYEQALRWFEKSLELSPRRDPLPYTNLGKTHMHLRQEQEALRILTLCSSFFPEDQDNVVAMAAVLDRLDKYEEAIQLLQPLVKKESAIPDVFSGLGFLFESIGKIDSAVEVLRRGYAKYPEDESITHNLIYGLLMADQVSAARSLLEASQDKLLEYMKERPNYEPILMATWGLLYIRDGDLDLGSRFYQQAAKIAAKLGDRELIASIHQKLRLELARAYLRRNDIHNARHQLSLGTKIKRGRQSYRTQLQALSDHAEQLNNGKETLNDPQG